MLPAAVSSAAQQCSTQPPWHHSGFHLASVLEESMRRPRQTQLRPEKPSGPQRQKGQVYLEAGTSLPKQALRNGVGGSHPGALSSCCVCASFFCAPHRCYENLRSPAGKVTSARAAFPQAPALDPAVGGWAPFNQPSCLHGRPVVSPSSPPTSSSPEPLPLALAPCSEFSSLCSLLSFAREVLGEPFQLRRMIWGFLLCL